MSKRQSNNPKRRIADPRDLDPEFLKKVLAEARYVGSALHKRRPADYGFHPPTNPRPTKSPCDDLRPIPKAEALALCAAGVRKGMVSTVPNGDLRKYVWSVDDEGEVFEAKRDADIRWTSASRFQRLSTIYRKVLERLVRSTGFA